ncbi:hypothetical protein RM190_03010 [Paracoccus sp. CPCC 101403]|uniref:Uncharacterized protein n=1 Tax=Paracoccus broussonetiae TaxID=3075834 RepID=A0ABU3E9B9_9RHOB|nr:hypothetical protein [Paracoccus sp. CPCC 101403]MDT1060811.1 hypothetical protein [Paracoccus sp. CPCC 101403]
MSLQGAAFLCIWNDHDPAQVQEYEAWHTFEHVPERVCVPGFIAGRRYADYNRAESRYFTLYDIDSLSVLETPPYLDLQANPTPWSQRMRLAFRNFQRIPCLTLASRGQGCAGAIGTLVLTAERGAESAVAGLQELLDGLLRDHAVTTYHLGIATVIPAYAVFGTPAAGDDRTDTYVVMVEGLLPADTDAALTRVAAALPNLFAHAQVLKNESSGFLFTVQDSELAGSPLRREIARDCHDPA